MGNLGMSTFRFPDPDARHFYTPNGSPNNELNIEFVVNEIPGSWSDVKAATVILQSDNKELIILESHSMHVSNAEVVRESSYMPDIISYYPSSIYDAHAFYRDTTKCMFTVNGNIDKRRIIVPRIGYNDISHLRKPE